MAYVQGEDLEYAWSGLSTDQIDSIFADLKQHISSLRELQPPAQGVVSSALQNPAYDCRIGNRFFGPMTHDEFHSLTLFAHADLSPRNIIVKGGRIVAILDWAFAGWYPEYWDFTRAHYNLFFDQDRWEEYLRLVMPCYEMELTAERILWDRLPEPAWLQARAGRQLADLWTLALRRERYVVD
ncbi:phosphotransferase enzyme family protein [Hirsutella rhossiliensis]|uniref:Phosphotransferase enzyme family domain-containing protein n=1 Tax=Hirsutella rhossiliensis TaxID=111463 RepID=A0A9P8MU00_9HYPO|nr:phosphotransferase enzyme family domain-containing protein [Hirsutella rhossiliensis]KAH0961042.1 phosphotransferase enzyme family domain-containing protein [Hirsutella rhossiliensis]